MTMKRSLSSAAPDFLEKIGRKGFPAGLVCLVVEGDGPTREKITEQMGQLSYNVTTCGTCAQAAAELTTGRRSFDIMLVEANLLAKDAKDGPLLLEAAGGLPLVLMSTQGSNTEVVWRGIEVGAADVLEKPLSLLKLRNIWQHVVRKMMENADSKSCLTSKDDDTNTTMEQSMGLVSRCTLSSSVSAATVARFSDDKSAVDVEASCSGSQGLFKENSLDLGVSANSPENSHTADSPPGSSLDVTHALLQADGKPAKKAKKSKESAPSFSAAPFTHSHRPPLAIRPAAWPATSMQSSQPYSAPVVGMVYPCWASSGSHPALRQSVAPGCVWGTPLNPPPAWQNGGFPSIGSGSGPYLGVGGAPDPGMSRCNSAPVQNSDPLASFPELDHSMSLVDFTDDLLLGDNFLGDNFLDCEDTPAEVFEKPPIGLRLKKSESLVNLINEHLSSCRGQSQSILT